MSVNKYFLWIILAITMLWSPARADEVRGPVGEWVQIASNAGQCATCRLSISFADSAFKVQANNGWSAEIVETNIANVLSGAGTWEPNTRMTYAGKDLEAHFLVSGNLLKMIMSITLPNGDARVIRGTFKRELQNS